MVASMFVLLGRTRGNLASTKITEKEIGKPMSRDKRYRNSSCTRAKATQIKMEADARFRCFGHVLA